ncbi:MAG: hypothetical protein JNM51_12065 [Bacteroidia bacterium]|nr:hypothetical protein [Bacteroidia bacterium]
MLNTITFDVVYLIKKIAFYVFIVASLAVAVWGYLRLKESKEPNVSVLEHIPANAMCVIETKNCSELVSQLTRQNLIWNGLLTNESMQVAQNGIRYLDSLINSSPEIAHVILDNSVYWSFIKQEKTTEHLIQFKFKEKNNEDLFVNFFKTSFSKETSVSSFEAYYFTNNKQKWLLSHKDGIVYLSSDVGLLQNCLELKKEESIATNKVYLDLLKLNGEQKSQVYLNHTYTTILSKNFFTQQSLFGVEVQLNEITLTGYTNTDSSSLFNSLKNQSAESITGFEHLPDSPLMIQGVTVSDANLFYDNIQQQLTKEITDKNESAWIMLNDSALYNIKSESFENIDKEILSANYVLNEVNCQVLSLKIKDTEKSEFLLKLMSDSILSFEEEKAYRLKKDLPQVFSFSKSDLKFQYAYLSENHLLFFSNESILKFFQESFTNSRLLGKNISFMNYANDNLMLECNYLYYENSELLKAHNINSFINSEELWKSNNATSQISLTAKNYKNNIQVRINASHAQPKTDASNASSNILWSFTADTLVNSKTYLFTNHLTQENELCFQDEAKSVYLINSTGKLIWKKTIDETIQSAIYTVDIFKNGKLQMLFNSQNYLHLIDRNGNYVQGFPVKLPSKVTSDLTLLDYEGNKDYRLFLACADKRIYNFSLYGIKTEGFVPVKTDEEVILPINYVHVGSSDYLITADVSGKIYAFSRKGEGRIDFKNKTIAQLEHLYVLPGNNLDNTKLVYVDDKNNLLNKISLTDKKEALKIGDELNDFKTSFALVDDDSQSDVLVYGNAAFYAYDLFTGKLVEYFNELAVYDDVQFVQNSDRDWFLGFDKTGQKMDVVSSDGKLSATLQGATQKPFVCDLYKNGKTYVLLVNGSKVSCQELK